MRHDRATEEIRELAALYALGSLTQHEARSFEIHRQEGCSVCEEEFRRFEHAVAAMGFAVEEVESPEYLRDLVLARAEREPRTAAPTAVPAQKGSLEPSEEKPPAAFVPPPVFSQLGREKPRIFPWILLAALAALAILAAYSWKSALAANRQLQARASAAQADADNLRIWLDIQKEKAGAFERILSIAGKPGARIARLVRQDADRSSSGAVLWDTEQDECLLLGTFPAAPQGKAYQLWFVTPAARVPAGLVKTNPAGRTFRAMPVPRNAADAAAVLVTLEPDNGSQIPTMPFYAVGRFD